jgi:protein-disulfide isomerase
MSRSIIVALIVGAVLGFVVGRSNGSGTTGVPSNATQAKAPAAKAVVAPAVGKMPAPRPSEDLSVVYKVPIDDAACKGPATAKVTIVEFSDFQCPFCGKVIPTVKQVEEKYGNDLRLCFKHNPLSFHAFALGAAEVAVEAQAEGKFWEMHDKLFGNQQALDVPALEKYAQEVGMNPAKAKAAVEQQKYKDRIRNDQTLAAALGASGTPAFFVNGRKLSGAQPVDRFTSLVDEEIKKADALLAKGIKSADLYAEVMKGARPSPPRPPTPSAQPGSTAQTLLGERKSIDPGNAPTKGPPGAPVTIVAFSDFQCPFCSRVEPTIKQIEDAYPGKIRVAWKNKPLPFHQFATGAAEAAMAANAQGKFWEMHDKLFANQQALDRPALDRYAQELHLDMNRFRSDLDSHKYKQSIEEDTKLGDSVGAGGTPTFFINGRIVVGAQPFDSFKQIVDDELSKKVAKN